MKSLLRSLIILLISVLFFNCAGVKNNITKSDLDLILKSNVYKIKEATQEQFVYNKYPRTILKGHEKWETVAVKDWCSGFYPGLLWYAYEYSKDDSLKEIAQKFTKPLKEIAYQPAKDHDIGFQIYCSYGNAYRLTGNPVYKKVMLAAADTLATLYNPNVGSIHSWPMKSQYPHNTIIDNMMNLELLFWAAKNGGDKKLYDIAVSHATVTMKNLVRPDYSTYHLASFDDQSGTFIRGVAHQGYADHSMWARGQTWGIYGFAFSYRETGRQEFLETSIHLADKFLERLPKDGIPYWDFDDPKIPNAPKDASAAAVAASGMLELSTLVKDQKLKDKYKNAAIKFIKNLSSDDYLSKNTNQALLLHSTGHHPKGTEIDASIIYADYYFMEALLRLKKMIQ